MLALTIIGQVWLAFAGNNITAALIGWCIACIGSGSACTMFFAMVGDTVDFGEWKNGIRANGFLTAIGASFCIQMGSGIGSFISFSFLWAPVIIYIISMLLMVGYRKWEKHEPVVQRDLEARAKMAD